MYFFVINLFFAVLSKNIFIYLEGLKLHPFVKYINIKLEDMIIYSSISTLSYQFNIYFYYIYSYTLT